MLPEIGQSVADKYTIERRLGQGGMAVVFSAHHKVLDRPVAMKILSPELPRTEQLVERFLTEARAAARIDSPYVARVFDAGTLADGLPFIVMERLDGCDLEELLNEYKRLPIGDAVDYVLQALQGLAHAHALGVIHRDLKPANLFLAKQADGTQLIKILDFGIAKLVDEAQLMVRGTTMGSPLYMSPEQVRDANNVDPRADIWSIGVVLYELMTGKTPLGSGNIDETFAAVLEQEPTPARKYREDIPVELETAVMRCLNRDPAARFASVSELAFAITQFGTGACAGLAEAIDGALRQQPSLPPAPGVVLLTTPVMRSLVPVRIAFADERSDALYGDATASTVDTSFFDILGDALEVIAVVLVRDDAIARGREDRERLPKETSEEIERLRALATIAKDAIAGAPKGDEQSPSARVAAAAMTGLESSVSLEIAALESNLAKSLEDIPLAERAARDESRTAFENLLLHHDLPGSSTWLDLHIVEGRYTARIHGSVDYGVRWTIDLEIPPKHALSRPTKLEKLARIEVDAPELTGFIRKEIKLKPQRLDKYFLTSLELGAASFKMQLRESANGEGDGYDVEVDIPTSKYELARPGAKDEPHKVDEAGAAKLTGLHATLCAVARDLAASRKVVAEATLDGEPLCEKHDPHVLVERLVAVIVPIVREIGMRSPSSTELALKRLTTDNRREEIFVSKATLRAKLEGVPDRERAYIGPLLLALESVSVRSSQPSYPRIG